MCLAPAALTSSHSDEWIKTFVMRQGEKRLFSIVYNMLSEKKPVLNTDT